MQPGGLLHPPDSISLALPCPVWEPHSVCVKAVALVPASPVPFPPLWGQCQPLLGILVWKEEPRGKIRPGPAPEARAGHFAKHTHETCLVTSGRKHEARLVPGPRRHSFLAEFSPATSEGEGEAPPASPPGTALLTGGPVTLHLAWSADALG